MKIGVFDSGKGGTTILSAIKEVLPEVEYFYIGDNENCPYGEKSDEELMKIVTRHVETLKNWGAEIIVIACNTATTKCIEKLREKYPELNFIGTEPAIKLAAETGARKILVLATPGTVKAERTLQLLHENQRPEQRIDLLACAGLADAIETGGKVGERLDELAEEAGTDYKIVVLGCTHYSLVRQAIQKRWPEATLMDGNEGVVKRVLEYVEKLPG